MLNGRLDTDAEEKGQVGWLASILKVLMTCVLVSKFHVYLPWVNTCLA